MRIIQNLVLSLFNRLAGCRLQQGDIATLRALFTDEFRVESGDIAAVRLLVTEGLSGKEDEIRALGELARINLQLADADQATLTTVLREGLRIGAVDAGSIRYLLESGVHLEAENVRTLQVLDKDGIHLDKDDDGVEWMLTPQSGRVRLDTLRDLAEGACLCYSQEGESLILNRLFDSRDSGCFVDIGAYHPKRFSNTYALYVRGWTGVNIDPTPGLQETFEALRPADRFFPVAISDRDGRQDFYLFNEQALNTFDADLVAEYQASGYELIETRSIECRRLDGLLDEAGLEHPIDLMSIDVEGHELQALQSNDWARYRPAILLVEILNFDLQRVDEHPVHEFLVKTGYALFAKTYNTVFYRDIAA